MNDEVEADLSVSETLLNALALDAVQQIVDAMNLNERIFGRQWKKMHVIDDIQMCRKVLERQLVKARRE